MNSWPIVCFLLLQEQFKKPKKVTKKKIRSRKPLKADDLLAMNNSEASTTVSVALRPAENRRPTAIASASKYVAYMPLFDGSRLSSFRERSSHVSLDRVKRAMITTTTTEDGELAAYAKKVHRGFHLDDLAGGDEDLSSFTVEDDAFDELQAVVNKTMKLKSKKDTHSNEKVR